MLLKQYANYIRQRPTAENATRLASAQSLHHERMSSLQRDVAIVSVATLALDTVDTRADEEKAQADAATACHDLSNVQTALGGGLALGPALYGRTYLGIAGLIAPFFFSRCSTGNLLSSQTRRTFEHPWKASECS